ncbi:MAG: hypothetical protein GY771_07720 [bacterium]|nr:hypothetical protein [bacterium]
MERKRNIISAVRRLALRRRVVTGLLIAGWAVTVTAFAALCGLLGLWLLGAIGGITFVALSLALASIPIYLSVIRPLIRKVKFRSTVLDAEEKRPELRFRLLSAFELAGADDSPGLSEELSGAFVEDATNDASGLNAPLPAKTKLFAASGLATTLLIWMVLFLAFPGFLQQRIIELGGISAAVTGKTIVRVEPGDAKIGANRDLRVDVYTSEDVSEPVYLVVNREEGETRIATSVTDTKLYSADINAGNGDFTYYVLTEDDVGRTYDVEVVPPPDIRDVRVTVYPPAYTGLPAKKLPAHSPDVIAYPGSKVAVSALCGEANERQLEIKGGEPVSAKSADGRLSFDFTVMEPGAYRLSAGNEWGETDTPYYGINVMTDTAPAVEIIEPEGDIELADSYPAPPLASAAAAPLGISGAVVRYHNETTGQNITVEVPGSSGGREISGEGDLIVPGLDMFPGDVISYYVEVYDNDTVHGPKAGRSEVLRIRFPTMAEVFEDMNSGLAETETDLAGVRDELSEFREELNDLNASGDESGRPERAQIRELLENQKHLRSELMEIAEDMENLLDRAEEGLLNPELAQKMWQVNEMLEQILDEDTKKTIEKLKEAMSEVDPERLKELMEEIEFDQQQMEANLDRMLAMLEELRRDQELSEMAFKARELAEKQDDIVSELSESENESDCAREEMKLSDEINQLENDLESATDDFAKTDAETAADLNELAEETANKELPEMAAAAAREMSSGQSESALKKGEQVSDDLNELANELDRLQQQYRESQKQQLMADVQGIVDRLLFASFRLENFAYESYLNPRDSLPERQRSLGDELTAISEELADLAVRSFFISAALGESVAKASDATFAAGDNLALGNNAGAAKNDLEAMAHVNLVALALLDAKSSISNSSSSMGLAEMMEQMKAMAEAQKQINNQSDSAMQMMPGMKPGDLQSMLEAMAAEQAMLRREMQKMMNRMGENGEKMGDVGGMIDEMRELEEMLKEGRMDERVREKQEELLERMLSTHRAMRNKGKSSKRRSEVARDYTPVGVPRNLPPSLTAPRRTNVGGRSGANPGYVAPEYDEATSDYFRRLAGGK